MTTQNLPNEARAGQLLYEEHQARDQYSLMAQDYAPQTIAQAYACQKVFMDLRAESTGGYAGYKIGYATQNMQQLFGISEPAFGRILQSAVSPSGAVLSAEDYIELLVECEVGIRINEDITDGPFDKDRIFAAVGEIMVAFEIVDSRPCLGPRSIEQSISTNIINAGAVLGEPVLNWRELDIPGSECRLSVNGSQVGSGRGTDVIGHPVLPICWLAEALVARGEYLRRGDIVLTGSMIAPHALVPGDEVTLQMENLGEIGLSIQGK
ncbi:MAG: fumarylacetoacetate hydrolase family protein [Pseudomonadales bacterium]|nr:fumarylacetoacetate hydrolase family protein [Pseudomonadales bacterium]